MREKTSLAKSTAILFMLLILLAPASALTERVEAQETTEQTAPEAESSEAEPSEAEVTAPPDIDAEAWAIADAETGLFLAGENADERLPIASITKVMVALTALEGEADLDEEVVISEQAERFVGFTYSNVGLIQGERVGVRELLLASLVPSGTDAVHALAEHLGGGGGEAGVEEFVETMNQKAEEMNLENTSFANPAGLDDPENYSSARDLTRITAEALDYPVFSEIVRQTEATITTNDREIEVVTTNQLLFSYPAATGVKTGTSPEAGPSLVASAEKDGESYIAVILGAASDEERFTAAEELLRYAFDRYEQTRLVTESEAYEEKNLPFRRGETVELVAARSIAATTDPSLEVERKVTGGDLPESAEEGDRLGEVEVFVEGQSVGTSPLVAGSGYEEASILNKIWFRVTGFFQ